MVHSTAFALKTKSLKMERLRLDMKNTTKNRPPSYNPPPTEKIHLTTEQYQEVAGTANAFGLSAEQQAFVLTHYQELTVSDMRRRLHVGVRRINKFLDARGLVPKQVYQSRRIFRGHSVEGFFNVDTERNWLIDDGKPYSDEPPLYRKKSQEVRHDA